MATGKRVRIFTWVICLRFLVSICVVSGNERTLSISEPTSLELSPDVLVDNSPGYKPGIAVLCERVHVHGLSRIQHLSKMAHSVRIKVVPKSNALHPTKFEVCFHRNLSLGICMCPQNQWEKVGTNAWVRPMSPFDQKLLDIRVGRRTSKETLVAFEVSAEEEFFLYRLVLLGLGFILMTFASSLSKSLVFYYSSAMAVGIILVILMVLFQRRGVVEGVDYGATGEVKKVDVSRIQERLDGGCIVLLSNVGSSSTGEVLNCNTYEVATACALAIGAEKLICIIDGPILDENGRLIQFLTLEEADTLIRKRAEQSETAANYVKAVSEHAAISLGQDALNDQIGFTDNGKALTKTNFATFHNGVGFDNGNGFWNGENGFAIRGLECQRRSNGYLSELSAAAFVCRGGVQRVHLLDGTVGGSLLLELFQRDGMGTMVASDLYEGTRTAEVTDLSGIRRILKPLEESGTLVRRIDEELLEALESFIVVEREGQIVACAALFPFFEAKCGEVAGLAVSPDCRGQGQGDKLLDYIEKRASSLGLNSLFLLTTRTADWFVRRGFSECSIDLIPDKRRKKINLSRGSKYYMKKLEPSTNRINVDRVPK